MPSIIRPAKLEDCKRLVAIYTPYVQHTAVSFSTELPDVHFFSSKLNGLYPLLVAEVDGEIVAYAYGSAFRPREAYQWGVELSIYTDSAYQGKGIGKNLYQALLNCLQKQGFQIAYGVITLPNDRSIALHESLGFTTIGIFHKAGFKLGQWHDVAFMKKDIGHFPDVPSNPTAFHFELEQLNEAWN